MGTFDEMLASLHPNSEGVPNGADLKDAEASEPIVINGLRQFEVPEGYNLTIAYEGDVNSQKITFKLPRTHEGHDLAGCGLKVIRWKNTSIKAEDSSNLNLIHTNATNIIVEWIVPPAAFVAAGNIEVAITFYDVLNDSLAFSWNTASFSGFKVEKTLSQVGKIPNDVAPAKNEVLYIDEENHNIVAPNGYNFVISAFGNRKTTKVYFQTTATVGGIPLINENTKVFVIVSLNGQNGTYDIPSGNILPSFSTSEETGDGLVNFVWDVPTEITCNNMEYIGEFSIAIKIEYKNAQTKGKTQTEDNTQVWKTVPFTKLTLAKSLFDSSEELLSDDYTTIVDAQEIDSSLPERRVSGISLFKRGTTEDWEKSTYVAAAGETIIYVPGPDETAGYRVKYGNGVDMVKDLPFQTTIYIMTGEEEELPEGYEIYLDPSVEPYAYELTKEEKEEIAEIVTEEISEVVETTVATLLPGVVEEQLEIDIEQKISSIVEEALPELVSEELKDFAFENFAEKENILFYRHRVHLRYNWTGTEVDNQDGCLNVFFTIINNDKDPYSFTHQWNTTKDIPLTKNGTMTEAVAQQLKRLYSAIQVKTPTATTAESYLSATGMFIVSTSPKKLCVCNSLVTKYYRFDGDNFYKRLLVIRGTAINTNTNSINNLHKDVIEISCGAIDRITNGQEEEHQDLVLFTSQPIICRDEVDIIPAYQVNN